MNQLPAGIYLGGCYDSNVSAIVPMQANHLTPLWCYVSSDDYRIAVRKLEPGVKVNNATLVQVSFDLAHWAQVGSDLYPNGLPDPWSDDPTQWLFHGHPAKAEAGTVLHVALARLAGYGWPAENDPDMHLSQKARAWIAKASELPKSDADGVLCLPAVAGERSLVDRLRAWLAAAIPGWSAETERQLLAEADARFEKKPPKDGSLEAWLCDRAFAQHCTLFHQRPFLWQIWDGLKDGFSAFLHYHRLTKANLEKVTYNHLGDWIARQRAAGDDLRLEKALILQQTLQKIIEGEDPYDIFVRWKPLAQQPLGWDPDLDDGVRLNIRPFVEAGILRARVGVNWNKDRGRDVATAPWYRTFQGERINDHHTTLAEKRHARGRA